MEGLTRLSYIFREYLTANEAYNECKDFNREHKAFRSAAYLFTITALIYHPNFTICNECINSNMYCLNTIIYINTIWQKLFHNMI